MTLVSSYLISGGNFLKFTDFNKTSKNNGANLEGIYQRYAMEYAEPPWQPICWWPGPLFDLPHHGISASAPILMPAKHRALNAGQSEGLNNYTHNNEELMASNGTDFGLRDLSAWDQEVSEQFVQADEDCHWEDVAEA